MQQNFVNQVRTFGTTPVFFTSIATILVAIMFLRFGFAAGQVGFMGAIAIIIIGHAVTIPTAMAIAEIATNQKVEGGGEYYIISPSFGRFSLWLLLTLITYRLGYGTYSIISNAMYPKRLPFLYMKSSGFFLTNFSFYNCP